MQLGCRPVSVRQRWSWSLERFQQVNDKNIAVRVPWELWKYLDNERATRQVKSNKKVTLSDIVREALETHVGDTWTTKQNKEQK